MKDLEFNLAAHFFRALKRALDTAPAKAAAEPDEMVSAAVASSRLLSEELGVRFASLLICHLPLAEADEEKAIKELRRAYQANRALRAN